MKEIKVKGIEFTAKFKGNGCVNYDDNDQKYFLVNSGIIDEKNRPLNDNVTYAKKTFSTDEDGDIGFKYKVSSACIRHNMYKEEMDNHINENHMQLPYVYYNALATPAMIERGYMYTLAPYIDHKKSAFQITDAIEIRDNLRQGVTFDFHTKSVKKGDKINKLASTDSGAKGDTSIYRKENVGLCNYISEGFIDLDEMQFISLDELYDRRAVNIDVKENELRYMNALKRNIPNFSCEYGFFYMKNGYTQDEWAEKGILLSEDVVDYLTKDIIKRILNVSIWKSGAYFKFDSLVIKYYGENGEETVEITHSNINDFKFIPYGKYLKADDEKIKRNKELYEEIKLKLANERKSKKKTKSSKKSSEETSEQ